MLLTSVVIFLVAALGGLVMAAKIMGGKQPPMPLALIHGAAAATALVLALLVVLGGGTPPVVRYGVGILVVAALGGFFLFSFHLRGKPHPKAVVVIHAGLAVAGVLCLASVLL